MKKYLAVALLALAAAALIHELGGRRPGIKPAAAVPAAAEPRPERERYYRALVIAASAEHADLLKASLKSGDGVAEDDMQVRLTGSNDPKAVAAHLEWARDHGVRIVALDGGTYEPGDPLVAPLLQALGRRGVKRVGTEFVD